MPEEKKQSVFSNGKEDDRDRVVTDAEKDAFWDLDALLPQQKKPKPVYPAQRRGFSSTGSTEISVELPPVKTDLRAEASVGRVRMIAFDQDANPEGRILKRYVQPHTAEEQEEHLPAEPEPEDSYVRADSLVHGVRVYPWRTGSSYPYYANFCREIRERWDDAGMDGELPPPVPFFSVKPQYSQLDPSQREFYFAWRQALRAGQTPEADYSYLLLYAYEQLNVGTERDPAMALEALCELLLGYEKRYPQLIRLLGEWICDLCLLYRLPAPAERLKPLLPALYRDCSLREFFADGGDDPLWNCTFALLANTGGYDYTKSRFYEAGREWFDRCMPGALHHALLQLSGEGRLLGNLGLQNQTATRYAFQQAVCCERLRKKLEVDYYSLDRSYELKFLVTDLLKYTENRIRARMGIKSRLSIYALPTEAKNCVEAYLKTALPPKETPAKASRAAKKTEPTAPPTGMEGLSKTVQALYETPRTVLSPEKAKAIEKASWVTTDRLVEAFESEPRPREENEVRVEPVAEPEQEMLPHDDAALVPDGEPNELRRALGDRMIFVQACLEGDAAAQRAYVQAHGLLAQTLVDAINEAAADLLGDILLEESSDGSGYAVLEDYRELLE